MAAAANRRRKNGNGTRRDELAHNKALRPEAGAFFSMGQTASFSAQNFSLSTWAVLGIPRQCK